MRPPYSIRCLREAHLLTKRLFTAIFAAINVHVAAKGLMLKEGTMSKATIIAAPRSTKHPSKGRDPERHQAKKENQWHVGMKAPIGVDAESGLV